jgi:hypothetical protein
MPNGRSGGFIIEKTDLAGLVNAMPDSTGLTVAFGGNWPRPTDASEVVRLLESYPSDRLAVEKQDHGWYIIHVSNQPVIWVTVFPESPIFPEMCERHKQWTTANPGWNGWIAF